MNVNLTQRTVALPANGQVTVDLTGTFILFYANTGAFQWSVDGGQLNAGFSVLAVDTSADPANLGKSFTQLLIRDTSGSANSVSLFVGSTAVSYINALQTSFVKNAPSYTKISGSLSLADGAASAAYTGADSGGQVRKAIYISNLSPNTIYAATSASAIGVAIPTGQSIVLETNGSVSVLNSTGSGASSYSVLEVFYS